ncbi:MAG TPA: ectonucleotide pyrophosphatase/phosphodiesterase [Verrucomicrobiae bacterium]|nr:ectonucleotide pyrophosphatase/phosphodiesterase [Verrucomicrobiae bacterium]
MLKPIQKILAAWIICAFTFLTFNQPAAAADSGATNQVVVMISVDGLAAFYFDDPKAEMPTIRELASKGAHASAMRAVAPTVTWPNHTTLVTGVMPAKHGVIGNNYFDRAEGRRVTLIADPEFDKDQIVKVPTLYDVAKADGLKTAAVRWPATRNAKTLDWTIPDMAMPSLIKNSTPALITECESAGLRLDSPQRNSEEMDSVCAEIFNHILKTHRPNLALFHIINVDHVQHGKGPRTPEAYAAIKAMDQQVRLVWEELQRDYPGRATLFVVSDHGFSPVRRTILPNVVLRQAGLVGEQSKPKVEVVVQGGCAMIYVRDEAQRTEILKQVRKAFTAIPGVKVVGVADFKNYGMADPRKDPHAPDLLLFADEGCAFGNTASGDEAFKDKLETSGTHGHDPHLAHLHAMFVAYGAGIKPGIQLGEISNTSVAPTIARLLNLKLPDADGPVLTKILADETNASSKN